MVGPNGGSSGLSFTDVSSSDYFYEPVAWAVETGITKGVSDTSFAPSKTCTRAEAVTFLWRSVGSPEPKTTKNPFTDIQKTDYFYKAVLWAVDNNITVGTSATTFSPSQNCSRAHVVTFLHRLNGTPSPNTSKNPFGDVTSKDYFYKPVLWAVKESITQGVSQTAFGPNQSCTRGQIVTFLYRAVN